jgi:hypothetical protein
VGTVARDGNCLVHTLTTNLGLFKCISVQYVHVQ